MQFFRFFLRKNIFRNDKIRLSIDWLTLLLFFFLSPCLSLYNQFFLFFIFWKKTDMWWPGFYFLFLFFDLIWFDFCFSTFSISNRFANTHWYLMCVCVCVWVFVSSGVADVFLFWKWKKKFFFFDHSYREKKQNFFSPSFLCSQLTMCDSIKIKPALSFFVFVSSIL